MMYNVLQSFFKFSGSSGYNYKLVPHIIQILEKLPQEDPSALYAKSLELEPPKAKMKVNKSVSMPRSHSDSY